MVWGTAAPAHADSIVIIITSGSFTFGPNSDQGFGPLTLFGTNGFSVIAVAQFGNAGPDFPLFPGAQSRFFGIWSGNDLPGIATFGGETFTNLRGLNSANQLSVDFESAPFTLPPIAASATIIAPFTLTGNFRGAPGDGNLAPPTVVAQLIGSGIGTLSLVGASSPIPVWNPLFVTLALSTPTIIPEPSTWLLVPTAVGLTWLAHEKRRATKSMHCPPWWKVSPRKERVCD